MAVNALILLILALIILFISGRTRKSAGPPGAALRVWANFYY